MLPMQIRFIPHEVSMTAAMVPYGVSVVQEMEFAFLVEDEFGEVTPMTPYEFACTSKACAPPPVGTGGSKPSGGGGSGGGKSPDVAMMSEGTSYAPRGNYVGKDADQKDQEIVKSRSDGQVGSGGLMVEPWQAEDGTITLTDKQEKSAAAKLEKLGTSESEWVSNLEDVARKAMADPERALKDAQWYQHEHDTWGAPLAKAHGVTVEQVMGIAAATSTNKQWDGVKSSNKDVAARILEHLKNDTKITITPEDAAAYNQFSIDKPTTGGKYGPKTIEAGEYTVSQLSSGTLARIMGKGYGIGGQYYSDGLYKAFAVARGEITPNDAIGSPKQRSFTNNLARPDVDYSTTNDFWMARAMLGPGVVNLPTAKGKPKGPQTVREWEQAGNGQPNAIFGGNNLYPVASRAAQTALRNLASQDSKFKGMKAHEFQALIWVQMQREYAAGTYG